MDWCHWILDGSIRLFCLILFLARTSRSLRPSLPNNMQPFVSFYLTRRQSLRTHAVLNNLLGYFDGVCNMGWVLNMSEFRMFDATRLKCWTWGSYKRILCVEYNCLVCQCVGYNCLAHHCVGYNCLAHQCVGYNCLAKNWHISVWDTIVWHIILWDTIVWHIRCVGKNWHIIVWVTIVWYVSMWDTIVWHITIFDTLSVSTHHCVPVGYNYSACLCLVNIITIRCYIQFSCTMY